MKSDLKTKPRKASVTKYLEGIKDPERWSDCQVLLHMMEKATRSKGVMWGSSMIGFGDYRYKYASGREGDWFLVGFANRAQGLTLYLTGYMYGFEKYKKFLDKLGPHTHGRGCLYIKRLSDINQKVLESFIKKTLVDIKKRA